MSDFFKTFLFTKSLLDRLTPFKSRLFDYFLLRTTLPGDFSTILYLSRMVVNTPTPPEATPIPIAVAVVM